jgi:hypothetical protein
LELAVSLELGFLISVRNLLMPASRTGELLLFACLELLSLVLIGHLWLKRKKIGFVAKCVWTIVLLAPALGPVFYGFSAITQDTHGDDPPDTTGGWGPPGVDI